MVNIYRQLISNCASVSELLTRLTQKVNLFCGGRVSSRLLIVSMLNVSMLTSQCVMAHPDIRKPFRLYTDATDVAVGAE